MDIINVYALKALLEANIIGSRVAEDKLDSELSGEFELMQWVSTAAEAFAKVTAGLDEVDTITICFECAEHYAKLVASEVLADALDVDNRAGPAPEYTALPPSDWLEGQARLALAPAEVYHLKGKLAAADQTIRDLQAQLGGFPGEVCRAQAND